jgi:hypothetical protein
MNILVEDAVEQERYLICTNCELFESSTKMCKDCWCFMPAKVKLAVVECPQLKWTKIQELDHGN